MRKLIIRKKLSSVKSAKEYIEYLNDPGIKELFKAADLPKEFHCSDQESYLRKSKYLRMANNGQPILCEEALGFFKANIPEGVIVSGEQSMLSNWLALKCDLPIMYPEDTDSFLNTPALGTQPTGVVDKIRGAIGRAYTFSRGETIPPIIKAKHIARRGNKKSIHTVGGVGLKTSMYKIIDMSVFNGDCIFQCLKAADIAGMIISDKSKKANYYLIGISRTSTRVISAQDDLSTVFSAEQTDLEVGISELKKKLTKDYGIGSAGTELRIKFDVRWDSLPNGDVVYVINLQITSTSGTVTMPQTASYAKVAAPWHLTDQDGNKIANTRPSGAQRHIISRFQDAQPVTLRDYHRVSTSGHEHCTLGSTYSGSLEENLARQYRRQLEDQFHSQVTSAVQQLQNNITDELITAAASSQVNDFRRVQMTEPREGADTHRGSAIANVLSSVAVDYTRQQLDSSLHQEVRRQVFRRFRDGIKMYMAGGTSIESLTLAVLIFLADPSTEEEYKEELIKACLAEVTGHDRYYFIANIIYPIQLARESASMTPTRMGENFGAEITATADLPAEEGPGAVDRHLKVDPEDDTTL